MKEKASNEMPSAQVTIEKPDFKVAVFNIVGIAPLVVHRMSEKFKKEQEHKIRNGKSASSTRNRKAQDPEKICEEAKYVSQQGWEGFQASAFRNAMIRACSLTDSKMTLAKMSIFIVSDGWDKLEPQIPLVKIIGKSIMQKDVVRMANGTPNLAFRPAYHNWKIRLKIRWDNSQFSAESVANLLARAGLQVGIGEGRPMSKNSAGMGWGLFRVDFNNEEDEQ